MNKNLTIIYAKKQDANEIIELVHHVVNISLKEVYPESVRKWFHDYHSIENLNNEFDDSAHILVVKEKDKIIATGTYYLKELKRVFISPNKQKLGLGKRLMNEMEKIAKENGDEIVLLYANPSSWKYYENMGYETLSIAVEKLENGDLFPYCRMKKNLIEQKWHVRKAELKDAKQILEGQKQAFLKVAKQHNHMDMPPMVENVEDVKKTIEDCTMFVVEKDGAIFGSVRGEVKDEACYISRLWVLPKFQRMYVGDCLMYRVEDEFDYLDKYELFTGSNSKGSINFYLERGYTETKREKYRDYELVYFEKQNAVKLLP
ncbi:MAG: GNAT family N-acetyltransferase [Clostridiales bacterium]|nr:GNAT family N-acetyltransferase [Clostridiales bacterium]